MSISRVICPKCNRSVRNLNSYHYCMEVFIDDLFQNKPDEVMLAFDRLLSEVSMYEDIEVSATKNCIVFVRNKTFLVVKPMKKCLEIKFYATCFLEDDELYRCTKWNSKFEGILRVTDEEFLKPKHFQYIKNSYQIS